MDMTDEIPSCMISAHNKWLQNWDLVVIVFAIYNCLELPVDISFKPQILQTTFITIFNLFVDSCFFIDIVIRFRTSFIKFGVEIWKPKLIAINYFQGTFIIDLLSVIPFETLANVIALTFADPEILGLTRLLKLIRLLRIAKVIVYLQVAEDVKAVSRILLKSK